MIRNTLQKQNSIFLISQHTCRKIKPHVYFYKQQIKSLNETAHHILKNKGDLILPQFPTNRKERRSIITSLITGFTELA